MKAMSKISLVRIIHYLYGSICKNDRQIQNIEHNGAAVRVRLHSGGDYGAYVLLPSFRVLYSGL